MFLETRVLRGYSNIRKVVENKTWFTVKEDVVAIDPCRHTSAAHSSFALANQFKSSKYLSFVLHTFGVCMILDAHNPAMLSLVDTTFCCILHRFALILPQTVTDVPDNSFTLRILSSRHTHSEQVSQK